MPDDCFASHVNKQQPQCHKLRIPLHMMDACMCKPVVADTVKHISRMQLISIFPEDNMIITNQYTHHDLPSTLEERFIDAAALKRSRIVPSA
jgi:hypothetical protein